MKFTASRLLSVFAALPLVGQFAQAVTSKIAGAPPDSGVELAEESVSIIARIVRYVRRNKTAVTAFAGLGILVSTASAAVAPEAQRHLYNSQRLQKLHPYMRPKVGAILADLESHGDRPVIDAAVWRTPSQQAALLAAGRSTVSFSFHNATSKTGQPESLAADLPDFYHGYSPPAGYWLRLNAAAKSHGLETGVVWGLSTANRKKISSLVAARNWSGSYTRGWDPSHVEPVPAAVTLGEARRGLRPPVKRK